MSEQMAPVFYEAAVTHIQKHPEVESVYRSLGYNTIRRRAAHPNRKSAPLFLFPAGGISYNDIPSSPAYFTARHLPLAPIAEGEVSGNENGRARPSRQQLRLRMPKAFHVTPLEEKPKKKMTDSKGMPADRQASQDTAGSSQMSEAEGKVEVVNERSKGWKKLRTAHRSKAGKSAKPVARATSKQVDEELPLLDIHPLGKISSASTSTKT